MKLYPYKKWGENEGYTHAELGRGGTKSSFHCFNMEATSFSHTEGGHEHFLPPLECGGGGGKIVMGGGG